MDKDTMVGLLLWGVLLICAVYTVAIGIEALVTL